MSRSRDVLLLWFSVQEVPAAAAGAPGAAVRGGGPGGLDPTTKHLAQHPAGPLLAAQQLPFTGFTYSRGVFGKMRRFINCVFQETRRRRSQHPHKHCLKAAALLHRWFFLLPLVLVYIYFQMGTSWWGFQTEACQTHTLFLSSSF